MIMEIEFNEQCELYGQVYYPGDMVDLVAKSLVGDFYHDKELFGLYSTGKVSLIQGPDSLRIHRVLPTDVNPLYHDFTILGFRKQSPLYSRGTKQKAIYLCAVNDEVIVEKIFKDIYDDANHLVALEVTFNYYREDNSIGLTKTEVVKNFNKAEARTELRKRRARQIDFLEAGAEGTPIEPYVNALIEHYDINIQKYIIHGTNHWLVQIWEDWNRDLSTLSVEEQQYYGAIKAYLAIEVPEVSNPSELISIRDSLIYQITGVDKHEIINPIDS